MTDLNKWKEMTDLGMGWKKRSELLSQHIIPNSSVLDLGSGSQVIKQFLPKNCSYKPCDCIKTSKDCIVCDFNLGQFPEGHYDYVVVAGVLEYMDNQRSFIKNITKLGNTILLTYRPPERFKQYPQYPGYILSKDSLEALLTENKYNWTIIGTWMHSTHTIYRITVEQN
jgi:hypothetical protein